MSTAQEEIGKIYTRLESQKGKLNQLWDSVFGNGLPGHEKRIKILEDEWGKRRESCPFLSDKQNRIVIAGLVINSLMMVSGFLAIIVSIKGGNL